MDGCKLQKNTGIYLVRSDFFTLVALGARVYFLLQGALTMICLLLRWRFGINITWQDYICNLLFVMPKQLLEPGAPQL